MAVEVEPQLLEILACPCPAHARLRPTDDGLLTCASCGRGFPVRDGIPVLLLEEAVGGPAPGDPGEG
ncbi:Trm112 family protein [Saccharopolyspora taberi]|uniref:Trm112 family protein n=1 Tax=Saccharopolyspora taberi TaxID=60895 RepID=UPI0031E05C83